MYMYVYVRTYARTRSIDARRANCDQLLVSCLLSATHRLLCSCYYVTYVRTCSLYVQDWHSVDIDPASYERRPATCSLGTFMRIPTCKLVAPKQQALAAQRRLGLTGSARMMQTVPRDWRQWT